MADKCKHDSLLTFKDAMTQEPVGLWACATCRAKFVPLDIAMEKDAKRYRWLRAQHTYDGEGDSDIARWYVQAGRDPVPCDPGALDDEIDAAMAARVGAA